MAIDALYARQKLEWSVRALAQPFAVQTALFPSFVCVTDELALEFDEALRLVSEFDELRQLDRAQRSKLDQLDAQITRMSGQGENAHFWTDASLAGDREWNEVRTIADDLVLLMGWSADPPPANAGIYVASE